LKSHPLIPLSSSGLSYRLHKEETTSLKHSLVLVKQQLSLLQSFNLSTSPFWDALALVLSPTPELATQIQSVVLALGDGIKYLEFWSVINRSRL